jgi:PKD repeat protein
MNLSFIVSATDPDGDPVTITQINPPAGATPPSSTSGVLPFSWTPSPGQAGTYSVTFTATDNGTPALSDTKTVTITVMAAVQLVPMLSVSPDSLDFGQQQLGDSSTESIFVTNFGNGVLLINAIGISGSSRFTQTNNCGGSLSPGAFCWINVTFTTFLKGFQSATLSISSNASSSPNSVALSGTGVLLCDGCGIQ